MRIPRSLIFRQDNRGDTLGDLYSSYNLNLSNNLGALQISPRMILAENSSILANMGVPCAFRFFKANGQDDVGVATRFIWAVAGARIFHSNAGANGTWKQDITGGSPTALNSDQSDMALFNGAMYVSGASTSLFKNSSGVWSTLTSRVANSSGLHQMTAFRQTNRLYFVDDNAAGVGSIGTDDAAATLGQEFTLNDLVEGSGLTYGSRISCIVANTNRIFIGTINSSSGRCKIYAWDGITANKFSEEYSVFANGILAMTILNDEPVAIDTRGRLLQRNGSSFMEFDRLPFAEKDIPKTYLSVTTSSIVHYNGLIVENDKILINLNAQLWDTGSTQKDNIHSGVWEWTKETGLYHKMSYGLSRAGGTIEDYGQQKISKVGAIYLVDIPEPNITQGSMNGKVVAGVQYYTDATTAVNGIFYDDLKDTERKAGSFVTPKILASEVEDVWQKVYARFSEFRGENDIMVVKSRKKFLDSQEVTVTWTGQNSFTTTTDLTERIGWEVEGIQGKGSGMCAHITNSFLQDGVYHTELDNGFNISGTGKIRIMNWTKEGEYSGDEDNKDFALSKTSSVVQLKFYIETEGEFNFYDLNLINKKFNLK